MELIVVIVLIAVMAGLTVGGILAWRDWADFNRENEYAETLFVAAQNQLNDYSADGRLDAMQKALRKGNTEEYKREKDAEYKYTVGKNWVYSGESSNAHFVESGYSQDEINSIWENRNLTIRRYV